MGRIPCPGCGVPHDTSELEPSFTFPTAIGQLSEAERPKRAKFGKNFAMLIGASPAEHRWFMRMLLPFEVEGRDIPCSWGIWVELAEADFHRMGELWNDPDQASHGPWPGTIANDATSYPSTIGLRGSACFLDPNAIPYFALDLDQTHPFVQDWEHGVTEEKVLAWLEPFIHGVGARH